MTKYITKVTHQVTSKCGHYRGNPYQVRQHELRCRQCALKYGRIP